MARIFAVGTAPLAKGEGYDRQVKTVVAKDEVLLSNHAEEDVVYVRGAAVRSRDGYFWFARMEKTKPAIPM